MKILAAVDGVLLWDFKKPVDEHIYLTVSEIEELINWLNKYRYRFIEDTLKGEKSDS